MRVLHHARRTVEAQHAAADPLLSRELRDQLGRQVEIEILDFHRGVLYR